jgi:catechol 2,3-dioxygenase-like lactoylglutathione lyase family enzyme
VSPSLSSVIAQKSQAPPVTGLVPDHVTLSVANVEREAAWYERVLGFKVFSKFESDPSAIRWHLMIPGYRIDFIQYKGSTRPVPVNPSYLRQGWIHVVFHVDDLVATLKTLHALQVEAGVKRDDKGNITQLTIHDPEGNELEIRPNQMI